MKYIRPITFVVFFSVAITFLFLVPFRSTESEAEHPRPPVSVVSLTPSLTEILFALGAGDTLAGRTRYCDFPPEALEAPVVGGFDDVDVEKVLLIHPDLVVAAPSPGNKDAVLKLRASGIRVEVFPLRSVADVLDCLLELGGILDREREAAGLARHIRASIEATRRKARSLPSVPCLLVVDQNPTVLAAPGSFPHEIASIAGGKNLVEKAPRRYIQADPEWLAAHPPQVVLDFSAAHAGQGVSDSEIVSYYSKIPGWTGKVTIIPVRDDAATVPGPRAAEAAELLFRLLHARPANRRKGNQCRSS